MGNVRRVILPLLLVLGSFRLAQSAARGEYQNSNGFSYHIHLLLDSSGTMIRGGEKSHYYEVLHTLRQILTDSTPAFIDNNDSVSVFAFGTGKCEEIEKPAVGLQGIRRSLSTHKQVKEAQRSNLRSPFEHLKSLRAGNETYTVAIIASDFAHDVFNDIAKDIDDWKTFANESILDELGRRRNFVLLLFVVPVETTANRERQNVVLNSLVEKFPNTSTARILVEYTRQTFEASLAEVLYPIQIQPVYLGSDKKELHWELVIRNYGDKNCHIEVARLYRRQPAEPVDPRLTGKIPDSSVDVSSPGNLGEETGAFPDWKPIDIGPGLSLSTIKVNLRRDRATEGYLQFKGWWGPPEARVPEQDFITLNNQEADFLLCSDRFEYRVSQISLNGDHLEIDFSVRGQRVDSNASYDILVTNRLGQKIAVAPFRLPEGMRFDTWTTPLEPTKGELVNGSSTLVNLIDDELKVDVSGAKDTQVKVEREDSLLGRFSFFRTIERPSLKHLGVPAVLWATTFIFLTLLPRTPPTFTNLSAIAALVSFSYLASMIEYAADSEGGPPLWLEGFKRLYSTAGFLVSVVWIALSWGVLLLLERHDRALRQAPLAQRAADLRRSLDKLRHGRRMGSGAWFWFCRILALVFVAALIYLDLHYGQNWVSRPGREVPDSAIETGNQP